MPWRFRLVERQRGYIFLDPTNTRTAAQLGAPAAKKKIIEEKIQTGSAAVYSWMFPLVH